MSENMKKIEEVRKELLVAKEIIEENLERLNRLIVEEETVTLRIQYETEREETITIPLSSLCLNLPGIYLYMERTTGPLAGKAFLLNEEYDWKLGVDDEGALCLVPIRKEVKNKKKDIIGHFEPR